jgi:hypothetical protein
VAEDREVREKELQKVCGRKQGSSRSREERFQIQVVGSGRTRGKDQRITDSQSEEAESRGDRLAKSELTIRSQSLIARRTRTVDLVPKHSPIQKIGKEEEALMKVPKCRVTKGVGPRS